MTEATTPGRSTREQPRLRLTHGNGLTRFNPTPTIRGHSGGVRRQRLIYIPPTNDPCKRKHAYIANACKRRFDRAAGVSRNERLSADGAPPASDPYSKKGGFVA